MQSNRKPVVAPTDSSVRQRGGERVDASMVGYARASVSDPDNRRQLDELVQAGVAPSDVFMDAEVGRSTERPAWASLLSRLERGDTLVVVSGDRLGRSLAEVAKIFEDLNRRNVVLKILATRIDTRTSSGRAAFDALAGLAQIDRELARERTAFGLRKARDRGVVGGREETYTDDQIVVAMAKHGSHAKAAKAVGASKITMIRRTRKLEQKGKPA